MYGTVIFLMNAMIAFLALAVGLNNSGLNRDLNPDLCNASTVLYQLSFQANREQVVMWVIYKPVDAEIDDDNTIFCILNAE